MVFLILATGLLVAGLYSYPGIFLCSPASHCCIHPALLLLGSLILSAASGYSLGRGNQQGSFNKIINEWHSQDAKLKDSIQSDQVKLLEAKIATLEKALETALKKGK